jgi:hypothetical protein
MDKKWLVYAGLVLLGVVLAPKIRTLPLMSKLPSA